ncbi:phosphotransferase family protein [Stackebrandtia nassauensis]|uniref:Hygromycin-B kinase n=1 Tax=Stackebrandtia nassauensis (strain DSM 44728 / CIP 108903 / NRRL B-16338 / NBRC 102104 / LLR-40K-21) TaxID=446470 RepID=D3Q4Y8_STANL|nr:phosphotransferase [Stackebrandtia nassauensis]ADD42168.1 Hygromycin-B kinase [Stackebrandtia nassauensis DSM 44728]
MTKPSLSPQVVHAAVNEALGQVDDFAPITEGQESQAFEFRSDGREFVVRVNGRAAGFLKDRWAAERVPAAVPVPEVVHIGQIDEAHHFCVSVRSPGTIVQDCDTETLHGLSAAMAETLDGIAATDVADISGYGDFDAVTGEGKFDSWAAYILHSTRHDWSPHADAIDVAAAERLTAWLRQEAAGLPDVHELVHGDFGGDNVLVEPGRVTAVLDWEGAVIGDRLYDVARMRFWAPFMESMRIHTDHLLAAAEHDSERLRCYVVANGLDATAYFAAADQTPIAQAMLARTLTEVP